MSASVIRFPDVVSRGGMIRATTRVGRDALSNTLGLPCLRPTEIEAVSLDAALIRGDVLAYDLPVREGR